MKLFSPLTLGSFELPNRLVMAPLTRSRSDRAGIPNDMMVEHYRQRASMGLIITESTYPAHAGQGFVNQPGLADDEQFAGWKRVTDAVHAESGQIVVQVKHAGRASHPHLNGGYDVVAPSAIAIRGLVRTYGGKLPYPVPRALDTDELRGVVEEFVTSCRRAVDVAGFDGVEVHVANGYLLHQFLSPASNRREDQYGGSSENRARFVIEHVHAVVDALGAGRVGIRISPEHNTLDALETDPGDVLATYGALIDAIAPLNLAYLSILHPEPGGELAQTLRKRFDGPVIMNSGFADVTEREEAISIVEDDLGDAVAVGRLAIANPDLVRRWQENLPVNEPDFGTFYTRGTKGYTDYPIYSDDYPKS